jgi:hypothetical protein
LRCEGWVQVGEGTHLRERAAMGADDYYVGLFWCAVIFGYILLDLYSPCGIIYTRSDELLANVLARNDLFLPIKFSLIVAVGSVLAMLDAE